MSNIVIKSCCSQIPCADWVSDDGGFGMFTIVCSTVSCDRKVSQPNKYSAIKKWNEGTDEVLKISKEKI